MQSKFVVVVLALVLLLSLACGPAGTAAGAGIDCPDGMEPHRASQQYHGWTFETGGGTECASGMCIDFSGEVVAYNRDEASWDRCGDFMAGIPNCKHGLCTADGFATVWWDGTTNGWVCVKYNPE